MCFALRLKLWLSLGRSLREERPGHFQQTWAPRELLCFAYTSTFQSIQMGDIKSPRDNLWSLLCLQIALGVGRTEYLVQRKKKGPSYWGYSPFLISPFSVGRRPGPPQSCFYNFLSTDLDHYRFLSGNCSYTISIFIVFSEYVNICGRITFLSNMMIIPIMHINI